MCIRDSYLTASFNALAALNAGAFVAGIGSGSFVAGLIPVRAARSLTSNLPKPLMSTFDPSTNAAVIEDVYKRQIFIQFIKKIR